MTTLAMLACATSDTDAVFAVKVATGPARIALVEAEPTPGVPLVDPVYAGPVAVDARGIAKIGVSGLESGTRYWWRVEDNGTVDDGMTGTFLTPPPAGAQASFTFGASGDAGLGSDGGFTGTELLPHRISNHPIHAYLAERMIDEDWVAHVGLGDIIYYDYGRPGYAGSTVDDYHRGWDDLWLQPNQVSLFLAGNFIDVEDDHDGGPNDWDGTFADKGNFAQVFRERQPHHALPDAGATYRTWMWGRAQVVILDTRYYRSPMTDPDGPAKTMLGAAQKTWLQGVLDTSTAEVMIVISPVQWMSGGAGSWPGYATERDEVAQMFTAAGRADRMVMLSADGHLAGLDTGGGNQWGHWPCAVFAARDASPSTPTGDYDLLEQGGIEQYGTVTVTDLGGLITVKLTAWQGTTELASYTKAFAATAPVSAADVTEVVSGSHTVVAQARVCTDYQTGSDPVGETITVLGGDVAWDATADVWSTASLDTAGISDDVLSLFPRYPGDLLAPYGNELFIRYGIDVGSHILWTPLGYYRINDTDQNGASDATISLTGTDRMQNLIDAKLVTPRQYRSTQSIAAMVYDLVHDVLPEAVIAWDDDDDQLPLGRDVIVEKDRYAALRDIATSRGKVCYFDSEGVMRFEAVPDPEAITWEIKAGSNGVLVTSGRSVSRTGMYNGVVARGEGTESAPMAVAVDIGDTSPTRWGGKFGKVPREYASPLITDTAGAYSAAVAILQRSIGMPKSVDFGTVPNPVLRPRQAVRITQKDHNRERHLVQTLKLPLTGGVMSGTTREQTLARIGRILPGSPDL